MVQLNLPIHKALPLLKVVAIMSKLKVSFSILYFFVNPVHAVMLEYISLPMIIHPVNAVSFFCSKVIRFITFATITVTRLFWAERAESLFGSLSNFF